MSYKPFKMRGYPRQSGITPIKKTSPAKLLPIGAIIGAGGAMAWEKINKELGGMGPLDDIAIIPGLDYKKSAAEPYLKYTMAGGTVNPIARYAVDKIDEWRASDKKPSKTIDYGEKDDSEHNVSARKTEGTIEQQKKRRLKQQLKKYGPGHPKRRLVYDALDWKYDHTIKK